MLHPQSTGLGLGFASVSLLSPQASQAVSTPGKGLGLTSGTGAGGLIGGLGLTNPRGTRTTTGATVTTPLLPGTQGNTQGKGTALTMFSNDSNGQSTHPTVSSSTEGGGIAALALAGQTSGPTPLTLSTTLLSSPIPGVNSGNVGGANTMPMSPLGIAGGGGGSVMLLSPTGSHTASNGVGVGLLGNMGGPSTTSTRTLGAGHAGASAGGQGLDRDLAQLTWWSRLLKLSTVLSAELAAALVYDATSSSSLSCSSIDSGMPAMGSVSSSLSLSSSSMISSHVAGEDNGSSRIHHSFGERVASTGTTPSDKYSHNQYRHVMTEEMAMMLKKVDRHGIWMYMACPARLARHLLTPLPNGSNGINPPLLLPMLTSSHMSSTEMGEEDDEDDMMQWTTPSYAQGYQDMIVETAKELRDKEAMVDHGYRMILQVMRNSQGKTLNTLSSPLPPSTAGIPLTPPTSACDLLFAIEHCLLMAAQHVQGTYLGTGGKQRGDTLITGTGGKSSNNGASAGSGVGGSGMGGVQMVNQNTNIFRAIARFTKKLHARRSPLLQGI